MVHLPCSTAPYALRPPHANLLNTRRQRVRGLLGLGRLVRGQRHRGLLAARDLLFVPDFVASAGAVIRGVCDEQGIAEIVMTEIT